MSMIFMAKNGTGGRVRLAFLISILLAVSLMWGSVLAGDASQDLNPSLKEATDSGIEIEFNITNNDSTENITSVNITIPAEAELIEDTNATSGSWDFSNGTDYLLWENLTATGLINTSQYNWFNATFSVTTIPGDYTFNISVEFTDGSLNYSDHNITIEDTTAPASIILQSPQNGTWTNQSFTEFVFSYTELNPDNCTFYANITYNISNSTLSSPCYIFLDSYSQGSWDFTLLANDTFRNSGSNGTYTLGYDIGPPVGNSLGLFFQGENVSAGKISQLVNITISANVTDSYSGINASINDSVYARILNSTGGLFATVNLTHDSGDIYNGTWDTGSCVGGDNYTISVFATDLAGNTESVINTTLNITETPDLAVTALTWSSSNALPGWPHSGNDIYLNITVSNTGTGNVSSDFYLTVSVGGSEKYRTLLDNSGLDSGETYGPINVSISSGNFSSNRLYTFTIELDPEDDVDETCETNNTRNLFLTLGYNVSLYMFNGVAYPSVGTAYPDQNVSVNYTVSGANGTGVSGMSDANFSFWSEWSGTDFNITDRVYNWQEDGSGKYSFRLSTQGLFETGDETRARFGDNHLNITVLDGSWTSEGRLPYNITAPNLEVSITEVDDLDDIDLQGSSSKEVEFNVTLRNTGNAIANAIYIADDSSNDVGEANWAGTDDMDFAHSEIENMNLGPGEEYEFTVEFTVDDTMEDEYFYLYVSYNDTLGNRDYNSTDRERATVSDSGTPVEETTTTGTTGTTATASVDIELTLMDWPDEISGYAGEDNTTMVEVKNTGDVTSVAKVSLTCAPIEDVTVSPLSKSIEAGSRQDFYLDIDFSEDAEIGEYDCTLKAYVSGSEDDYDSETVYIRILPTTEQEQDIVERYQNISSDIQALLDRFALISQAVVGEDNYSRVKTVMDNLNASMHDAQDAIDDGDFLTASELMTTLQASMDIAEQNLGRLETEQVMGGGLALSGTWYWVIIIIVVVIAVAFVAYLMFPQKQGFGPRKGLLENLTSAIKGGGSGLNNIKQSGKDRLGGLAEKGRSVAPGQQKGYSYDSGEGIGAKLKSVVQKIRDKLKREKKPQKEVTQYFVNSSSKLINYS